MARGKRDVVDLHTKRPAPDPRTVELVQAPPRGLRERKAAARAIGLERVRSDLVTLLARCGSEEFDFDGEKLFSGICTVLEAVGPGKQARIVLAAVRTHRFVGERASRLLRAMGGGPRKRDGAEFSGEEAVVALLPHVRSLLLLDGGPQALAQDLCDAPHNGGFALAAEAARLDTGVRARELWGPVLRDPRCTDHHEIAALSVAMEHGTQESALLAEVLPGLDPAVRRLALRALNGRLEESPEPPDPHARSARAPHVWAGPVDGAGDLVLETESRSFDDLRTRAWLHLRLGVGVRGGDVRTNLTAEEDFLGGRTISLGLSHWRPAPALYGAWIREALEGALPPQSAGCRNALRLFLREADRAAPVRAAPGRDPDESDIPAPGADDTAMWRRILDWGITATWALDEGDLAALGAARPQDSALAPQKPPQGMRTEAWVHGEVHRRVVLVPIEWLERVQELLPGTPAQRRLVRSLRATVPGLEWKGMPRLASLFAAAADAVERDPRGHPAVRAWLERSALPDLFDDGETYEYRPFKYGPPSGREVPRRSAAAVQRETRIGRAVASYAWECLFAEHRPHEEWIETAARELSRLRAPSQAKLVGRLESGLPAQSADLVARRIAAEWNGPA